MGLISVSCGFHYASQMCHYGKKCLMVSENGENGSKFAKRAADSINYLRKLRICLREWQLGIWLFRKTAACFEFNWTILYLQHVHLSSRGRLTPHISTAFPSVNYKASHKFPFTIKAILTQQFTFAPTATSLKDQCSASRKLHSTTSFLIPFNAHSDLKAIFIDLYF